MKLTKTELKKVASLETIDGEHSEDSQCDAYELELKFPYTVNNQSVFYCDTLKEVKDLIKQAS